MIKMMEKRRRTTPEYGKMQHYHDAPPMQPDPVAEADAGEVPIEQRCTIFDLGEDRCKWPYGDPRTDDFFFCGGKRIEEARDPYCAYHAGRARVRTR